MPSLLSVFSLRGEIGRRTFWLIIVAIALAMVACIVYVEENFNTERKGPADLIIAATFMWVLCAAVIRRMRDIGLTLGDLMLLLLAAVWMAANIGLLREIGEAIKILQDLSYLPNPTGASQVIVWALILWSGIVFAILAFAAGEQTYARYQPRVRQYARKKTVATVILLISLALLILRFYVEGR